MNKQFNDSGADLRVPIIVGYLALFFMFGGIAYWAVAARIAGAVISSGVVQVEINRQVIQHETGGVVVAILAKDGQFVQAGQTLVKLDDEAPRSQLATLRMQFTEVEIGLLRRAAEREGHDALVLPEKWTRRASEDSSVARQVIGQTHVFESDLLVHRLEQQRLQEQLVHLESRIAGIQSQQVTLRQQIELVSSELANQELLLKRGLAQAAKVLELRYQETALNGLMVKHFSDITEVRALTAETRTKMAKLGALRRQRAVAALRDLENQKLELAQRITVLEKTVSGLLIKAPISGRVHDAKVFAQNSVTQPGAAMMYIVPNDEPMIVKVRVDPKMIDHVYNGQDVGLRFGRHDNRNPPEISGLVTGISADVLSDDRTGQTYFSISVMPNQTELAQLDDRALLPGKPIEVFFKTDERSPLAILTEPVWTYFSRSLRG